MNYSNIAQLEEGINIVFDLYRNYGGYDYIDEEVTQLQHAQQCAYQASLEYPDNREIILGAFLHDVGELLSIHNSKSPKNEKYIQFNNLSLNGLGTENHENIGADFLEKMGFPKSVSSLGRNHVLAKRYLITRDSDYLEKLSEASKETFKLQGGALSETEFADFELDGEHPIFLRMRHWDDLAKDLNFKYQYGIDYYRDMALNLLLKKYNHF